MSGRLRLLTGLLTTVALFVIGGTMLASGRWVPGGLVVGLGAFRAVVLWRQAQVGEDEDDD